MRISDWSSDVCSSDLLVLRAGKGKPQRGTDERPGPFARVFALPVEQSFKVGFLVLELGWRHIWIAYAHSPSALPADRGEQSKVVPLRDTQSCGDGVAYTPFRNQVAEPVADEGADIGPRTEWQGDRTRH